jgi:phosphatidylserine/phosphatidylglycerophosphate/cardiolipin synthase-like enzyme
LNPFSSHRHRAGRFARLAVATILVVTALFPVIPVTAASSPQSVTLLKNRDYLDSLLSGIRDAKQSIVCSFYLFKIGTGRGDHPRRIADELVRARQRGVAVKVILEDEGDQKGALSEANRATASMLTRGGVAVRFDSPRVTSHAKVVVIDGRYVYLGSHNITQSALTRNNELSLRIDSTDLAAEVADYLERF